MLIEQWEERDLAIMGWVLLFVIALLAVGVGMWAPELIPTLVITLPIARALASGRGPAKPVWRRSGKDRA